MKIEQVKQLMDEGVPEPLSIYDKLERVSDERIILDSLNRIFTPFEGVRKTKSDRVHPLGTTRFRDYVKSVAVYSTWRRDASPRLFHYDPESNPYFKTKTIYPQSNFDSLQSLADARINRVLLPHKDQMSEVVYDFSKTTAEKRVTFGPMGPQAFINSLENYTGKVTLEQDEAKLKWKADNSASYFKKFQSQNKFRFKAAEEDEIMSAFMANPEGKRGFPFMTPGNTRFMTLKNGQVLTTDNFIRDYVLPDVMNFIKNPSESSWNNLIVPWYGVGPKNLPLIITVSRVQASPVPESQAICKIDDIKFRDIKIPPVVFQLLMSAYEPQMTQLMKLIPDFIGFRGGPESNAGVSQLLRDTKGKYSFKPDDFAAFDSSLDFSESIWLADFYGQMFTGVYKPMFFKMLYQAVWGERIIAIPKNRCGETISQVMKGGLSSYADVIIYKGKHDSGKKTTASDGSIINFAEDKWINVHYLNVPIDIPTPVMGDDIAKPWPAFKTNSITKMESWDDLVVNIKDADLFYAALMHLDAGWSINASKAFTKWSTDGENDLLTCVFLQYINDQVSELCQEFGGIYPTGRKVVGAKERSTTTKTLSRANTTLPSLDTIADMTRTAQCSNEDPSYRSQIRWDLENNPPLNAVLQNYGPKSLYMLVENAGGINAVKERLGERLKPGTRWDGQVRRSKDLLDAKRIPTFIQDYLGVSQDMPAVPAEFMEVLLTTFKPARTTSYEEALLEEI